MLGEKLKHIYNFYFKMELGRVGVVVWLRKGKIVLYKISDIWWSTCIFSFMADWPLYFLSFIFYIMECGMD